MTSKNTQGVQQTGAGSKYTADVAGSRETAVNITAENCQFVTVLNVRT